MASKRREQEVSIPMAEQEMNFIERIGEAIEEARENARKSYEKATENVRKAVNDILDRITGKESSVELNLDDVGLDFGEERKLTATGTVRFSVKTLS